MLRSVATAAMPKRSAAAGAAFQLQLRRDPATGDSEWVVIRDDESSDESDTDAGEGLASSAAHMKGVLAATSYLDMLNDAPRNRTFRRAIESEIAAAAPRHVLDIGAGTGLLSMMAARAMRSIRGREVEQVTACESYLPMGKLLRKVLKVNKMEEMVKVFHKRSDELQVGVDFQSRADFLVSEILDSELLGEGLIPTLQHAHDMLLAKDSRSVPYKATVYGQLVESTYLWKLHDLHKNEENLADGLQLTPAGMESVISPRDGQYAMHCNMLSDELRLLSEPFEVFEFNFLRRPESRRETDIKIRTTNDGNIDAIISWWVLQLDSAGSVFYSTAPRWVYSFDSENQLDDESRDWCDHWKQCVWFIKGKDVHCRRSQLVSLKASHDETSISYQLMLGSELLSNAVGSNSLILLPERIALYGDKDWRKSFKTALTTALTTTSSPTCVVADDSVFLTLMVASLSKSSSVFSLLPGLRDKGSNYITAVANANSVSSDQFKVVGERISPAILEHFREKKVNLLVGEPFYHSVEGKLPWKNLQFWKVRTLLDPVLAEDVSIMPCRGILNICAMSLPDLWRSRCSLKDIEGFDHSVVNGTLGACGKMHQQGPCLPYYVWQCGVVKELSQTNSILEFNFNETIHSCSGKAKIEFSSEGTCHGFVLWIDWLLDESNSILVSTGKDSRFWKQGVQLLSQPVEVTRATSAEIQVSFDSATCEITLHSTFSVP